MWKSQTREKLSWILFDPSCSAPIISSQSLHTSHPPHLLIRVGTYGQNVLLRIRKCDAESLGFKVVCVNGGDKFETVLLSRGLVLEVALVGENKYGLGQSKGKQ